MVDEEGYESDSSSSSYAGSDSESKPDRNASNAGDNLQSDSEDSENSEDAEIDEFLEALEFNSKKLEEKAEKSVKKDPFDFPKDPENWTEKDLGELWSDGPLISEMPGWDPVWADEEDWESVLYDFMDQRVKDPAIAPFYLPYRKYYPVIPRRGHHPDIKTTASVIEELDRIEEFMKWVSYIFPDGSSYEGTIWDDLAHGKGVYVAERGLVRYEGEWLQNNMEGHGVVEVEIPGIEPKPGSNHEAKMRANGRIISRDFMSEEDREWLQMDIEDMYRSARGKFEIPFYENQEWVRIFGEKPEKGRYRYAGQWKHGRMHGCGVYEVNERPVFGQFYFGELVEDGLGCDEDTSTLHAGIAEVAAAKARMFANKPDGMVREARGPYSDPQHPYLYEEEDVWMAPGFINQFYEVPDYWKMYANEVDQEREMWLNSFYKAPLRVPMPAELEHWWSKDEDPEFVLINGEPEPDPGDPSNLLIDDPVILHTPTGRIINFIEDEEYGVRLFWQPPVKDEEQVEEVNPATVEFLPLGFDEFYGRAGPPKEMKTFLGRLKDAFGAVCDKVGEWAEKKKKDGEMKLKLIEQQLEFIEAEICLEEAIEDMDTLLKKKQSEEVKEVEIEEKDEEDTSGYTPVKQDGASANEDMEEGEEEEDDDDDENHDDISGATSFGSVVEDDDSKKNENETKPKRSSFATSSLTFASCSLVPVVPSKLQESFLSWKNGMKPTISARYPQLYLENSMEAFSSVSFPRLPCKYRILKATSRQEHRRAQEVLKPSQLHSLTRVLSSNQASKGPKKCPAEQVSPNHNQAQATHEIDLHSILSMHTPLGYLQSYSDNILD